MLTGRRTFTVTCILLLALLIAAQVSSMLLETQTFDEAMHLVAGYGYWKTGSFKLNPEHPPLFKLLAALPAVFLNARLPDNKEWWDRGMQSELGNELLYVNTIPRDTLLQLSRAATVVQTALLGLLVALWTRRKFGSPAALIALFLLVTDPNIIAHGRYITSDVPVTLMFFATVIAWCEYLERPQWWRLLLSGAVLGLALLTKFSAVVLVPVLALLALVRLWQAGGSSWPRLAGAFIAAGVIAAVVVSLGYGPATLESLRSGPPLQQIANPQTATGRVFGWLGENLGIPAHPYLAGLNALSHYMIDHHQYLFGEITMIARWYYFPAAFLVKTPTAVLILFAGALVMGLMARYRLRQLPLHWFAIAIPPLVYFAVTLTSNIGIGMRHLLPVYPFVFVAIGVAASAASAAIARWAVWIVAVLLVIQVIETARIYPHYLAFFNTVSGGPEAGPRHLLDSNIDWGQDAKKLRRYLDRIGWHGNNLPISFFGTTSITFYGIPAAPLPACSDPEFSKIDSLVAVSVNALYGVYNGPAMYACLRPLEPVAKVGYSIYLYDLRKNKTPIDWKDRGIAWSWD